MSPVHFSTTPRGALSLLSVLVLVLGGLLVAFAGPGRAAQTGPGLSLAPDNGPPGVQVTVTASGFDACEPYRSRLTPTGDGSLPTGEQPLAAAPVTFFWDDEPQGTSFLSGGKGSFSLSVPETASLETHTVRAVCRTATAVRAEALFTVTPPTEPTVLVPNLAGMTVDEARAALKEADLLLGRVTGSGDKIRGQQPEAGTEAERGSRVQVELGAEPATVPVPDLSNLSREKAEAELESVDLRLGSVSGDGDVVRQQSHAPGVKVPLGTRVGITLGASLPQRVVVPDLTGTDARDVPAVLEARGLVLGEVSGGGGQVASQVPAPGTLVPRGSAVSISVDVETPAPAMATVPMLVGRTVDVARQALADAGLRLGNDADGSRTVEDQSPAAGTIVPAGSAVTVLLTDPAVSFFSPLPWWAVPALVGVVLGAILLGPRYLRARTQRTWIRRHVRVAAGQRSRPSSSFASRGDDISTDHVVRIEPHSDVGTQVFEEADR